MAGTVGAIFNSALQLGSAVGSAAVTSIETSVAAQPGHGGPNGYQGRAAAFWFLFSVVVVEIIAVLVFYQPWRAEHVETEPKDKIRQSTDSETARMDEKV